MFRPWSFGPVSPKPGSRSDVRIQSTDLYPTILRMLNVERPKDHPIDGVDFAKALRGEEMDRGPMFTHVPGHGGTPHWLPPSMSVHHGDWKLIRTFHYGENGKHEYRLYNLREDIGEKTNLATALPEKLKELDKLIEDYITEANVVVPLPNPNFDPSKFDPSKIGVQPGGLKMPPSFQSHPTVSKAANLRSQSMTKSMLGWIAKNAAATVADESLRITPAGRQSFIANAKVRIDGPARSQASHPNAKGWNKSTAVANRRPGRIPGGWAKSIIRCRWRGLAGDQAFRSTSKDALFTCDLFMPDSKATNRDRLDRD